MFIILTSLLLSLLCFLALKHTANKQSGVEEKVLDAKWFQFVMLASAAALACNLANGTYSLDAMPFYLSVTVASLYQLSSSVIPVLWSKITVIILMSSAVLVSVFSLTASIVFDYQIQNSLLQILSRSVFCIVAFIFIFSVYYRISDVKNVMKAGSVWTVVCTYVDAVYVILLLLVALIISIMNVYVVIVVMTFLLMFLGIRIMNSSVFVVFTRHERRIIESMKVSKAEFVGESPGTSTLYKNIYERILIYFEKHQPYLNSELTINDIVDVVYTNKLYISKSISHCTGRNFCQFVNYYRITHSVKIFRDDPQLKVVELAGKSGFNSTTSFSAAFRLYMGENPGDWCRKERARLAKK
jgi:AraC-like DNA-binding protein